MTDEPSRLPPLETLIACPHCDALHSGVEPESGHKARCRRCGTTLIAPRQGAYMRITILAVTVAILMVAAVFLPFLQVKVAGLSNRSSVFDAALAFLDGPMIPLSLAVAALIVLIPILRVLLVLYVIGPMAFGFAPREHAEAAFRLSEDLRPWSMAEIFVIGVAVALIKVADLAHVILGPAFWMFAALVVVIVLQDGYMCRWSVWKSLENQRKTS